MNLLNVIPALPVRDIARAAEFYRDRLGFAVGHMDEGFGIVSRDGVVIHLWAAGDESWRHRPRTPASSPVVTGAETFLAGTASCRIEVIEVDDLYAEMKGAGVLYAADTVIEATPWGTREFPVLDLERNLLTFYERSSG
ncbi:MAG: bleomycin resistance family protein [Gemmatimonas sp.]|nr:bleomycin resistance family protein [Gemmatimonas sp.]